MLKTILSSHLSLLALGAMMFTTACDSDSADVTGSEGQDATFEIDEVRARSAVVPWGSCEPSDCGGQSSNGTCFCDEVCSYYGDCCNNKPFVCGAGQGEFCGGIAGIACDGDLTCVQTPGMCNVADAGGTCEVVTDFCSREYVPVCGCDGVTYSNECEANKAGAAIDYDGECQATASFGAGEGEACGVWTGTCAAGLSCIKPTGACLPDDDGVCTAVPSFCTEEYDPVCGCDGQTYSNQCHADQAGVTVEHVGACQPLQGEGDVCGVWSGTCEAGLNCIKPPGMCWYPDGDGVCTAPPNACSQVYQPVCGCDGVTYGNLCMATQAGASIERLGAC